MIKAVLDTNVLISGLLWEGIPKKIIDKYRIENQFILILSPELIHEFCLKLSDKFKVESKTVKEWLNLLKENAELVVVGKTVKVSRDNKDDMVIEAAIAGKADFIVSGDRDLLIIKKYENISILTPREFWEIID